MTLILLPSANNVAAMLARAVSGSQDTFLARMNDMAHSLGMRHTTYTDPSGFDEGTRSTADDQLVLAQHAMQLPEFAELVALRSAELPVAGTVHNTDSLLGHNGFVKLHDSVARAIEYMKGEQDPSGAWWGRWGVNYIYGTWQVLTGIKSVGQDMTADFVQKAAAWLRSIQKPDGSWGETCPSYDDPTLKGTGESTASQPAWAIMGLIAAAGVHDPGVTRGIAWLIAHQAHDGAWDESQFTGTGFPKVFYLKYDMYRLYFPLSALARYKRALLGKKESPAKSTNIGYTWNKVLPMAL